MKKRLYYAVLYILTIFILAGCDSNKGKEENIKKVIDEDDNVCYIKWAVPDDSIKIQDEWIIKINDRLRSEGYPFRLQLVRIIVDTTILASSDKKEQAFKLIEILRTKPEYRNLLIYGVEAPENAGYLRSGSGNKWVFEIDDGLIQDEEGELHFSSFEERNDYYNNHVTASPTLYMDFPPEYIELFRIVDRYLGIKDSIIEHDEFEKELDKFREEYTIALGDVIKNMGK